jgi:hypothetical protein
MYLLCTLYLSSLCMGSCGLVCCGGVEAEPQGHDAAREQDDGALRATSSYNKQDWA